MNGRRRNGAVLSTLITRGVVTVGVASLLAGAAHAFTQPMHFEHITLQDGLSQNTVMSILQDSQGFMWLATENGLNRYDGYSIRTYNRDRYDPDGLRSDFIWTMAEDESGDLWLATEGGGVVRWNRQTDTFKSYLHDPNAPDSPASNITRTLLIDTNQRVWIGTRESGLDLLDPSTDRVIHYPMSPVTRRASATTRSTSFSRIDVVRSGSVRSAV